MTTGQEIQEARRTSHTFIPSRVGGHHYLCAMCGQSRTTPQHTERIVLVHHEPWCDGSCIWALVSCNAKIGATRVQLRAKYQ